MVIINVSENEEVKINRIMDELKKELHPSAESLVLATEHVMGKSENEFVEYDVVSSCIHPLTKAPLYCDSDSTMQKYNTFRTNEIDYDADASLEAVVAYEKLFPFVNRIEDRVIRTQKSYNVFGLKYELGEANCTGGVAFRGDTMNSVATTNKMYFFEHKDIEKENFEWPKEALDFIDVYHTLGNFMVLPFINGLSVNRERGIGPSKDYFDIFLLAIYNFYAECAGKEIKYKRATLLKVLRDKRTAMFFANYLREFIEVDRCRFSEINTQLIDDIEDGSMNICYVIPGWEAFIEENLLQDYVTTGPYGRFRMPKELWKEHFDLYERDVAYPYGDEKTIEFWKNATEMIKKRSARMYNELHKK